MPTKVAIIHDWLVSYRGGERVLEAIAELFPCADVFTLFHEPGAGGPAIERHRIQSSFLDRIPGARKYHRYFLPLMPMAVESFDLNAYDLVISSSHCVAKGIIPSPAAVHISYCHTPMRYAWDRRHDYFTSQIQQILSKPVMNYLRLWDASCQSRVDSLIANSSWVASRIQRFYGRSSTVVFPFVDNYYLSSSPSPSGSPDSEFYLVASGQAPYKRIDLAIAACQRLGKKLVVVGEGQERSSLKALAAGDTHFLGHVTQETLKSLYQSAQALLFPGEEDFGIAPLEAMACGCPVIAYGRGGVTETVIDGKTGIFFSEQTVDSLIGAILKFTPVRSQLAGEACRERAAYFSKNRFQTGLVAALISTLTEKEIPSASPLWKLASECRVAG